MIEHCYHIDIPHDRKRIWALMNDYSRWTEFAAMVIDVDVIYPGDAIGNGLLRRVIFRMPFGRRGSALELVSDVRPEEFYTYTMISRTPGNDQTGSLRLQALEDGTTRLHFEERFHLPSYPMKLFEKPIYRFINRLNEKSMQALSTWLTAHPEY